MRYVGVDLAWGTRARTGLAALDDDGALLDLAEGRDDADVLAWLEPHVQGPCLVAFDAPLVVRNASGRRPAEAALSAVFARYGAGCHPTSLARPEFADGGRAHRLAAALGLGLDPDASDTDRVALEVYPHAATVALFGLDRVLTYKHKPGRDLPLLRSELLRLCRLLEGLADADPSLTLDGPVWHDVVAQVEGATRKSHLKAVEDRVDAVVCAYVALHAARRPHDVRRFGTVAEGFVLTPVDDRTR
ncbi:DUF429 domain-containing protein [Solicola sp. PLA-1-18]|uniref:DUF429 domain-containing protein n=1 Tax=Solicola sp. PLA-1-18 TaxID=3380532 RepID=UPI003B7C1C27